jgi:hypothetical protein
MKKSNREVVSDGARRDDGEENEQRAVVEQCVALLRREDGKIESVRLVDEKEEEEPSGAMIHLAENRRPFIPVFRNFLSAADEHNGMHLC